MLKECYNCSKVGLEKKFSKNSNFLNYCPSLDKKLGLSPEEKVLVKKCIAGDSRAQFRLYKKYVKAMYHTAVRMLSNSMDAEDVVQEVFVKVFKNLKSFKGDATLGAWIKRITINTTLNHLRKNNPVSWNTLDQYEHVLVDPQGEDIETIDLALIHRAIKQLPEGCRVIFNLFLLEGYRHQEIAEILKISESTSKSQYQRAKRLLRKELGSLKALL